MESTEGKGSTFTVTMPVQTAVAITETDVPADIRMKGSAKTILISEDDPVSRKAMNKILSLVGYTVLEAANGEEAVMLWKIEQPDVILMDMQMPLMDGLRATRAIRVHETELGRKETAIFGLTGNVNEEVIKICLMAGMTGHIGKPVNFVLLKQTLQSYFEGMNKESRCEQAC